MGKSHEALNANCCYCFVTTALNQQVRDQPNHGLAGGLSALMRPAKHVYVFFTFHRLGGLKLGYVSHPTSDKTIMSYNDLASQQPIELQWP